MVNFDDLCFHFGFDIVQVFVAFLHLVSLQLVVLCRLGALMLGISELQVLSFHLALGGQLVFFEGLKLGVQLNSDLLQVDEVLRLDFCFVLGRS